MENAVHLEGVRCDGVAHGGCQAGCLIFWKKSWLKRVSVQGLGAEEIQQEIAFSGGSAANRCDFDSLSRATRVAAVEGEAEAEGYSCQATELLRATTPVQWWDPRQYARDLLSRNVRCRDFVRYLLIATFNVLMRLHWRFRPYPYIFGLAGRRTPTEVLNLQPGELVQVRSKEEIMRTLVQGGNRNRGLSFDVEMVPYCGRTFRVLRRVERIINEKTGKMVRLFNACIILDGVTCSGCLSTNRLFCPRSIYPYWHEIWLKRVDKAGIRAGASTRTDVVEPVLDRQKAGLGG